MRETTLNDLMGFDHVIRILPDGTVDSNPGVYAPELDCDCLDDDCGSILPEHESAMIEQARAQGWEILTGWTGQYSYNGAFMHASEYIGGALEDHIWATPGYWVALIPSLPEPHESDGWLLAYREEI